MDRHGNREVAIFRRFAQVCSLQIQLDSIEKRDPLECEPDILCKTQDEGTVAFEMGEVLDEDLASGIREGPKIQDLIQKAYEQLPPKEKAEIDRRLGNAQINISFLSYMPFREKRSGIQDFLRFLQQVDTSFKGSCEPETSPLNRTVEKIEITREGFDKPYFNVVEGMIWVDDPTPDMIKKKFEKKYVSPYPMELLLFYELQPDLYPLERPEVIGYIKNNLSKSSFRRVWIFDLKTDKVKFVYQEA